MAENKNVEPQEVPIIRRETEKTHIFYSNDMWIGRTKWEIQMSFGRFPIFPPANTVIGPPDAVHVTADVTIIMTYEHAKRMLEALSNQIEKFEKMKAEEEIGN